MDERDFSKIDRWLDNLATEVVLAEPNSDQGLLPIRELFANLRDKTKDEESLKSFHAAAFDAVAHIEANMDKRAFFAAEDLDFIKQRIALLKNIRLNPDLPFTPEDTPAAAVAAEGVSASTPETGDKPAEQAPAAVAVETPAPAPVPVTEKAAEPAPVATPAPATEPAPAAAAAPAPVFDEMPLILDEAIEFDLLKEFFSESHEHLENVEQGALVLEDNPKHKETLDSIFRAFHSFKGAAGFLNLKPMNRLAHELESLLDLVRDGRRDVNATIIDVVLKGGDMLREYVNELEAQVTGGAPRQAIIKPVAQLIYYVRTVIDNKVPATAPAPVAASKPAVAETAAPAAATPVETASAPASATAPTPAPTEPHHEEEHGASGEEPAAKANAAVAAAKGGEGDHAHAKTNNTVVKVDTDKLDSLVDLVGEMVIAQSMVAQDPDLRALQCPRLTRNMSHLGRIVNDLQRTAMSMRMVPIRATFQKMNRLVRDLSTKLHKQIELKLSGEDTELDRTITEELGDPLIHMVRNSIDHGIEMPDVRVANGKPAMGTLHLNAFHQGGNIVIQITDDGAGLNEERILKKAIEKGIISEKQQLTKQEIFGLIFAPGFSTAEKVSDLSGRGVGMDVVRSNIEKLRGKVAVDSTPGKGAVFTLYLPLTLAIIDGLIVNVGNDNYILPTLSVKESFRPRADMISTVHERGEMVNVRGHLCPLLRLHDLFGIKRKSDNPEDGIIIVIESGNQQRCLMVDDLVGKQEVVIKSLGEAFKRNRALSGASILGDGRVGLILDVSSLVSLKERKTDITAMAA
jgi:two-component system, chemotaxis family, sensor kinase CheA